VFQGLLCGISWKLPGFMKFKHLYLNNGTSKDWIRLLAHWLVGGESCPYFKRILITFVHLTLGYV